MKQMNEKNYVSKENEVTDEEKELFAINLKDIVMNGSKKTHMELREADRQFILLENKEEENETFLMKYVKPSYRRRLSSYKREVNRAKEIGLEIIVDFQRETAGLHIPMIKPEKMRQKISDYFEQWTKKECLRFTHICNLEEILQMDLGELLKRKGEVKEEICRRNIKEQFFQSSMLWNEKECVYYYNHGMEDIIKKLVDIFFNIEKIQVYAKELEQGEINLENIAFQILWEIQKDINLHVEELTKRVMNYLESIRETKEEGYFLKADDIDSLEVRKYVSFLGCGAVRCMKEKIYLFLPGNKELCEGSNDLKYRFVTVDLKKDVANQLSMYKYTNFDGVLYVIHDFDKYCEDYEKILQQLDGANLERQNRLKLIPVLVKNHSHLKSYYNSSYSNKEWICRNFDRLWIFNIRWPKYEDYVFLQNFEGEAENIFEEIDEDLHLKQYGKLLSKLESVNTNS